MVYLFRDVTFTKAAWGRTVRVKTVRLSCKIVGTYGKDEVFIKLNKSVHFPFKGGITIRVLKKEVVEK
jgi:hypothetical protein